MQSRAPVQNGEEVRILAGAQDLTTWYNGTREASSEKKEERDMFDRYQIKLIPELVFAVTVAVIAYVGQYFADTNATTLTSTADIWAFLQVGAAGAARVGLVAVIRFVKPILTKLETLVD